MYFFEPKRRAVNRILATKNAGRPSIAKQIRVVQKVLYAIFFTSKGQDIQIPVRKGRTATDKSIKTLF